VLAGISATKATENERSVCQDFFRGHVFTLAAGSRNARNHLHGAMHMTQASVKDTTKAQPLLSDIQTLRKKKS
jgi:hypothetical protein